MTRLITESQRFLATVRYLTPTQIQVRATKMLRLRWRRLHQQRVQPITTWQIRPQIQPLYQGLADITESGEWQAAVQGATESALAITRQTFRFLNHTVTFRPEINWHDPNVSQLWRYHLHYFNYVQALLVLAQTNSRPDAYLTFQSLVKSWIENNQVLVGDGWHPYTLSLRLVNWIHAAQEFASELSDDQNFCPLFFGSLYAQARFLYTNLELDVRGNHLLENLRALIWVGTFFEGEEAKRWLKKGLALLQVEVKEQVLADGGHFERTPTYHTIVLQDLLEIALWLRRNQPIVPIWLEQALHRMLAYLSTLLPPDGKLPLLKDSAWDVGLPPQDLLAATALYFQDGADQNDESLGLYPLLLFGLADWQQRHNWIKGPAASPAPSFSALRDSGYYIVRNATKADYFIWDAGKPCPDYLPAHAHADMFSYELMIRGQRVVVDAGIFEYSAGPWRDFFRSTRAHNTVEVAATNQSEVWSSFRVGQRARPSPVFWQATADLVLLQAQHDGYQRLATPVVHRRTICIKQNLLWLFVDEVMGEGSTSATNYVHFHPQLALTPVDSTIWRIDGTEQALWLTAFGHQAHTVVEGETTPVTQGWYAEKFGRKEPNSVLALHQQGMLNICFGYIIAQDSAAQVQILATQEQTKLKVTHNNISFTLCLLAKLPPKIL